MFSRIRRKTTELRNNTSGNALLMVALGMPAIIGGGGLAVDTAQWYMWKRELQFATDQAALAAAWAMTDEDTEDLFTSRALQELNSNLSVTDEFTNAPSVTLADWAGGTDNSVLVTLSATKRLPFSSFLTGNDVTVSTSAQATFADGATYSSCVLAVSKTASKAILIQGNVTISQQCGIAALSSDPDAIRLNGGGETVQAGDIVAGGGIDSGLDNAYNELHPNEEGLFDPYASLVAPLDGTSQSYECVDIYAADTPATADTYTSTTTSVSTKRKMQFTATTVSYTPTSSDTWTDVTSSATDLGANPITGTPSTTPISSIPSGKKAGQTYTTYDPSWALGTPSTGVKTTAYKSSKSKGVTTLTPYDTWVYSRVDTRGSVDTVYNTVAGSKSSKGGKTGSLATMMPGTYTKDIKISCDTTLTSGIYVLNGVKFKLNATNTITGAGVMFVMKNGATIDINGASNTTLTAMSAAQMATALAGDDITQGSSAASLAGMLIMEVGNGSSSYNDSKINGNAGLILNGTIYMPQSELDISGTAAVTSQCLMLAAAKVKFSGNATFTNLCPPSSTTTPGIAISSGSSGVKLVG